MRTLTLTIIFAILSAALAIGCETASLLEEWSETGDSPIILGRPLMQDSWGAPDGRFRIHYDTTGEQAVFESSVDINPEDGIPDYVNRTADYLALSYDSLVTHFGFDPPPFDGSEGGDDRYDVYLTSVDGRTVPEYPTAQYPGRPAYTSYIELGHDLRSVRYPIDPYPLLKALSAHEFFHAVQFAYRAFSSDYTAWWFESSAMWAEEKVFDNVNDVYYHLQFYLNRPYRSLYRTDSARFFYGAWLLPQYLDEKFGTPFIEECWLEFVQFDFAVDAIASALSDRGDNFNDEYCYHVIWNYFTGHNFLPGFYDEAVDFPYSVEVARTHYEYPVEWTNEPELLENVAASYIEFERLGISKGNLIIEYLNHTEDRHAICLVVVDHNAGVSYDIYEIDSGVPSTFTVVEFSREDKVIMMPVWTYSGLPQEGMTSYQYSARLDTVALGIAAESGPQGDLSLVSAYPNPFNNSVSISYQAPYDGNCLFSIFDISGRRLYAATKAAVAGANNIVWTAPGEIASGVLFYELEFKSQRFIGKISLLK